MLWVVADVDHMYVAGGPGFAVSVVRGHAIKEPVILATVFGKTCSVMSRVTVHPVTGSVQVMGIGLGPIIAVPGLKK
jgi:hypothetical protein